jgi:hypothetical protein
MKKVFNIVVLTFIVVLMWIVFSIYSIYTSKHSLINIPSSDTTSFNNFLSITEFNILKKDQKYICITKEFTVQKCLNSNVTN